MANDSFTQSSAKRGRSSLLPLIAFALSMTKAARDQELQRYMACMKKPKQRNRFQRFFYQLHLKLERACSSIRQEILEAKGKGNDFSNR